MRLSLAPSPTGEMRLNDIFIVLWNYILKLKYNASLVLRIEDTNLAKSNNDTIPLIHNTLTKMKVCVNESPSNLGLFGPYKQSERTHIYKFYINKMLLEKKCFYCKCSSKRLNILKQVNLALNEPLVYDGRCLGKKYKMGKVRLTVPRVGGYVGTKSKWTDVDMPVLWNENKPTFHLANVIDDRLMKVSHVFRGKDWLTNLPKHTLLCYQLGFELPKYYHVPLLCNKGKNKLSKQLFSCGLNGMIGFGILPTTIFKYFLSIITNETELTKTSNINFNKLEAINVQVNCTKLILLNKVCIKELIVDMNSIIDSVIGRENMLRAIKLCLTKSLTLHDVYKLMEFVFDSKTSNCKKVTNLHFLTISLLLVEYKKLGIWTVPSLERIHEKLSKHLGISIRTFCVLIMAVFGDRKSISLYDNLSLLGKEIVVARLCLFLGKDCYSV